MKLSREQSKKDKAALWGIFPSKETFSDFKRDDKDVSDQAVPKFIKYARERNLIEAENEKSFLDFIEKNSLDFNLGKRNIPEGFTFSDLIEEISEKNSVNTLIKWLNRVADQFDMPEVQASMISRLRKNFNPNTPTKQNCLRILAFWICKNYPQRGWNYENLLKICQDTPEVKEHEGVRIAFLLEGRGSIIEIKAVDWLTTELSKCIKDLKLYHIKPKHLKQYATIAFLDIAKQKGTSGQPRLYNQAIRDSLALAHQITVRWALSEHCDQQKSVIIAIAAGEFVNLDSQVQALLGAKLPGDPLIRLTDFARLCARVVDVKVTFFEKPNELELPNNNILTVWSLDCFWTFAYYDFIPELLKEDMLPTTRQAYEEFKESLYFSDEKEDSKYRVLSSIHRAPQNTLLILEVAKVCASRRMYHEADTILSVALASNPLHMIARTFRMIILLNLALEQSKFSVSLFFFKRTIREGVFIEENCNIKDEEFYCEFGLVYFGMALRIFMILRRKEDGILDEKHVNQKAVMRLLRKAETCFEKGATLSPTGIGNRSVFWQLNVFCFRNLLKKDTALFETDEPIRDKHNIYEKFGADFFISLGWTDAALYPRENMDKLMKRLLREVSVYKNSVLLRTFFPNIKFSFASVLFDFIPQLTVGIVKMVIGLLDEARSDAENLNQYTDGIYSIVNCFSQIQSPPHFIRCINNAIEVIEETLNDDLTKPDDHLIDRENLSGLKLMLLNIDEKIESGVLLCPD
jgi:hypothetical protein